MNDFNITEDVDLDALATQSIRGFSITVAKREDVDPDAPATQCDAAGAPPPPVASVRDGDVSLSPLSD